MKFVWPTNFLKQLCDPRSGKNNFHVFLFSKLIIKKHENYLGLCTNNTYLNLQNDTYQNDNYIMIPTNKMIPTITIPTL